MLDPARAATFWAKGEQVPTGWTKEAVVEKYVQERLGSTTAGRSSERMNVRQGDHDAVEHRIVDQGVMLRTRIIIVGDRAYVLEAMSGQDPNLGAAVDRFFGSFRLAK
jgi:hypothetical protein